MTLRALERRFDRFRRTGDPAALAIVFDATAAEILRVASHLTRDASAAEDLLQRTFMTAIESASTWDRSRRLLPWLLGILANHAKEASRKAARTADPTQFVPTEPEGPVAAAERREEAIVAGSAIDELDDPERSILVLRYRHGLEPAEIALALSMPPATVRSHLHRGIERVRRIVPGALLAGTGFAGAAVGIVAVRRIVLARATAVGREVAATAGVGTIGLVVGGILVGKKAIGVAAALLLLVGGTSYVIVARGGGGTTPTIARTAGPVELESLDPSLASRPDLRPRAPVDLSSDSTAVTTDTSKGSIEVRLLARDGAPLVDEPFVLVPRGDPTRLDYRFARTGADGRARSDGLEPGKLFVRAARGPAKYVDVKGGELIQVAIRMARGVNVEGVVVDASGTPVTGAEIWIDSESTRSYGMSAVTRTKADGRFAVEDVAGYATISARASGHAPSACRHLQLGAGKTEVVRLALGTDGASVRGRVTDVAHAPVAAALIQIGTSMGMPADLPDGTQGSASLPFLAFTAADGTFELDGLPSGKQYVTVRAPGHGAYRSVLELVVAPTVTEWTIELPVSTALVGVVVDEVGAPVEGATVSNSFSWRDPVWCWITTTDSEGRFRIDDLPTRRSETWEATHDTKGRGGIGSGPGGIPDSSDSGVQIVLHPRARILVRLVDETGSPIARRVVFARTPNYPTAKTQSTTDTEGRAVLEVGDWGTYEVFVTDPDGDEFQASARLRDVHTGPDEVTFTLRERDRPTARIAGKITVLDGPIPDGARVWAMPATGTGVNLSLDMATGRLESKLLQPGRYEVSLSAVGFGTVPLGRVRLAPGQILDLGEVRLDPPGSLVVTLHGADGLVRSGGSIRAESARGAVWARPERDGPVRFAKLPPGRYRIVADAWPWGTPPTARASADVLIESGREAKIGLTAVPGHARRLRVRGLLTNDIIGLSIEVRAEGHDDVVASARWGDVPSDGDPGVDEVFVPGRYAVEAETADGRRSRTTFDVKGDGEPPVVLDGFK